MKITELSREDQNLYQAALAAMGNAYAPYSHFSVGAAVRAADGRVFAGANVENASYGLSICGERAAVFGAVSGGVRELECICVVGATSQPISPCGACRQVLAEFNVGRVILANTQGDAKLCTLAELLPYSFSL